MPDGIANATISATEANRRFSTLLRDVERGGRVTITKDGNPVAVLVPVNEDRRKVSAAALERFDALSSRGLGIGFSGKIDRDDLHRR